MTHLSRRTALIAACLMLAAGGCAREQPAPRPSPLPPPKADFRVLEARGVDPLDRNIVPQDDVALVVAAVNDYYNIAFIEPERWKGGAHTGVTETFTAEAQPQVVAHINTLALGELARSIEKVTPGRQEISKVAFFLENDGSVPLAIAEINFDATATVIAPKAKPSPKAKKTSVSSPGAPGPSPSPVPPAGPIKIVHTAKFWLVKQGPLYKVSAFAVDLKADTVKVTKKRPTPKGKR